MTNSEISIKAHDGGEFMAYVAMPEVTPAPAIIMIQEIFGVNQEMREKCDAMAKAGYVAICPDLFWRIEPGIQLVDSVEEQLQRAFDLFGQFNVDSGIEDLKSTLAHTRGMDETSGKVGCVGYCLGGQLAYLMAGKSDIDASAGYYGVNIQNNLELADNIQKPLMLHIAGEDEFVDKEAQTQIISAFENHPHVTTHHYGGMDHAFARTNGMHWNPEQAAIANERTGAFLKEALEG